MKNNPDIDATLPSVVADLDGMYRSSRLILTIAFHPDTGRIGHIATCSPKAGHKTWELNRKRPHFYPPGSFAAEQAGEPLNDQHVSRAALEFEYDEKTLLIKRGSSASRCQINGRELVEHHSLNPQELAAGIVITLAHRVVLLLREIPVCDYPLNNEPELTGLRGGSPCMYHLKQQIVSVAAGELDVLIRGETGSGKELVATAIHALSARVGKELVSVNMSAIPAALAPAALFGNAKGAYTGADTASVGYFEQAEGGTLFMDEIGDTPGEIQAQLLRVLQQREIQVVGGPVRALDFRVIAATDASLEAGSGFKAALRHRLGGSEILLEPLREHPEDIGELLWSFMRECLSEAGGEQLLPDIDSEGSEIAAWAELFRAFLCFPWPGNVRQLSNFAQLVAQASGSKLQLPAAVINELSAHRDEVPEQPRPQRKSRQIGEEEFLEAMAEACYEPTAAARILRIPRTAIYRRIEALPDLQIASRVPEEKLRAALIDCGGDIDRAALLLRVSAPGLRTRVRSAPTLGA